MASVVSPRPLLFLCLSIFPFLNSVLKDKILDSAPGTGGEGRCLSEFISYLCLTVLSFLACEMGISIVSAGETFPLPL